MTSKTGGDMNANRKDTVQITVNGVGYDIHRGRASVLDIKKLASVALADELAHVVEGKTPPLTPLADDGEVTIKGGESFVSYPRDSGSSHCLWR